MPIKKFSFLILLLTYLAGTFGLGRLNLNVSLEVRHGLVLGFLLLMLIYYSISSENTISRLKSKVLGVFILLLIYALFSAISMFYTPEILVALDKFQITLFLLLLVILTITMTLMMNAHQFFLWISFFFVIVGSLYAIPVLLDIATGASRGDVGLSGPNVTTRIFFFAACSALYLYNIKKRNIYILLGLLFAGNIIMVGSRGGLVGASVIFAVMFVIKRVLKSWRIKRNIRFAPRILLLIPAGLIGFYFLYEPVKRVIEERIIGTTFQDSGVYTSGRDILYSDAISMIKENPLFGHGLQAFTVETGAVYPHNLFLEMAVEIGLVGIILFLGFLMFALQILLVMKHSPLFIFSGIPLYMIIVQMFSGEFYDFRYYFLWLIPLLQFGAVKTEELNILRIKKDGQDKNEFKKTSSRIVMN